MTEISRRGFLKAFVAASAYVAIEPSLALPVSSVEPIIPPPSDIDAMEVFLKLNDDWEYLGQMLSITVPQSHTNEGSLLRPLNQPYPGLFSRRKDPIVMEGVVDDTSLDLLRKACHDYSTLDVTFKTKRGVFQLLNTMVLQWDTYYLTGKEISNKLGPLPLTMELKQVDLLRIS